MDTGGKLPTGQWVRAVNDILDDLKSKGSQIKTVTYSQYVDTYFPPKK